MIYDQYYCQYGMTTESRQRNKLFPLLVLLSFKLKVISTFNSAASKIVEVRFA